MSWLRSFIFNILFYGWTAWICIFMLWALLLPPKYLWAVTRLWSRGMAWIERHIGGIDYRVIGREYIPSGACIIAAKHQSAWETFKLHALFGDPAIVLKKELMSVPIWGWYARRAGVIAIDRARGSKALPMMMRTAHEAVEAGRKIVIFPQGTRLAPGQWKPYKSGVAALYQELNIPIVPMAHNAGLLWPKNSFIKKPGIVTVEFLPPIPPGLPREEMMKRLEEQLETASNRLAGLG